jgi:hypothetical protein
MEEHTDNLAVVQWIAHCAERLREQWPRADPTSLEETAADLGREPALRQLAPRCAAETWLGRGIPPSTAVDAAREQLPLHA